MDMKILTTKKEMYRCDCITNHKGTMELFRNRSFVANIPAKEVAQIIVHESMLPKKVFKEYKVGNDVVDTEVTYV
jgi:hypothetical protein